MIGSKLLQKEEGRKKGKYQITLEVTDYDIEQLEALALFDLKWIEEHHPKEYLRLMKWTNKMRCTFWKLWEEYDLK